MYDFIDHEEFLKTKQKKRKALSIKFDHLLVEKDRFYRSYLFEAYSIAKGNLALMSRGLKLSRTTLYKYLSETFGDNFKEVLDAYIEEKKGSN